MVVLDLGSQYLPFSLPSLLPIPLHTLETVPTHQVPQHTLSPINRKGGLANVSGV